MLFRESDPGLLRAEGEESFGNFRIDISGSAEVTIGDSVIRVSVIHAIQGDGCRTFPRLAGAVMIAFYRALATLIRQDVGNLSHRRAGAARNSTVHPLR